MLNPRYYTAVRMEATVVHRPTAVVSWHCIIAPIIFQYTIYSWKGSMLATNFSGSSSFLGRLKRRRSPLAAYESRTAFLASPRRSSSLQTPHEATQFEYPCLQSLFGTKCRGCLHEFGPCIAHEFEALPLHQCSQYFEYQD